MTLVYSMAALASSLSICYKELIVMEGALLLLYNTLLKLNLSSEEGNPLKVLFIAFKKLTTLMILVKCLFFLIKTAFTMLWCLFSN